jgi:small subunit ribosomal protein S18
MTSKKNKARAPREVNPKKFKKKTSVLVTEKVEFVDYKDVNLLQRFVSDRSKIRNRRVTGNDVQQQRDIANAVKNAREMALLPYTKRVSQTRAGRPPRDGDDRRERGPRREEAAATDADAAVGTTDNSAIDASDAIETVDSEVGTGS